MAIIFPNGTTPGYRLLRTISKGSAEEEGDSVCPDFLQELTGKWKPCVYPKTSELQRTCMTHSNNRLLYVWLSKRLIGWGGELNTCLLILFNGLLSIFSTRQKTITNPAEVKSNCFRPFGQNFKGYDFMWSHGSYVIKKWPENRVNTCFTQAHSVAVQETVCVCVCVWITCGRMEILKDWLWVSLIR